MDLENFVSKICASLWKKIFKLNLVYFFYIQEYILYLDQCNEVLCTSATKTILVKLKIIKIRRKKLFASIFVHFIPEKKAYKSRGIRQ